MITFPLTLADGSTLSEQGANCLFLSPQVHFRTLTLKEGPARLHRPYHGIPMRLEVL